LMFSHNSRIPGIVGGDWGGCAATRDGWTGLVAALPSFCPYGADLFLACYKQERAGNGEGQNGIYFYRDKL